MIGWRAAPSTTEDDKPKGFDDFELRLGDLMRGERATLGKSLLDVQRELKVKATYIAAIENCDVSAFETQGFVAGYVRSYARYLGMDPDWAYAKFCREANFTVAHGMSAAASSAQISKARNKTPDYGDPLANPNATFVPRVESAFSRIEPGAVGSLLVLLGLIGGLGYGGWSVLQEVQRVQLAPVDQAPQVIAEIDPLGNVQAAAPLVRSAPEMTAEADTVSRLAANTAVPARSDRLYRPEALEVPVLTSRDGPIASIDPARNSDPVVEEQVVATAEANSEVQVVASDPNRVELLAVRPSWVRVSSADGTVLFEKILDSCERYSVPLLEDAPVLRSGNSGAVYFTVNGKTFGPSAPGAQVVKNVVLTADAVQAKYSVVETGQAVAVADADNALVLCPSSPSL
ncbi:helix-turn-helix domain-containing protein [Pseudorhodobacter wandonensis]|jgi:cytoskeletal protein RodZ|uniref:helix-turn-helix domain-containing protein n=1 Tax=Pseudorhodobacter wandonensis TaxID=1120568 RepID=UPI00067E3760|nr:helix-turn-helix domain-containing protein [Pseudorhodobacter wandonensis]